MDSLESLQRRIAEAFQRIEDAAKTAANTAGAAGRMQELAAANAQLASEIDSLKARRGREADQLDALINRLKPLVKEVANA